MKTVVIHPSYASYTDFINRLPDIFHTQGETIYQGRNEIKVFDVNGVKLNVKKYKVPIYINRLIYTFFRTTKAYRAYTYALKLLARGIETPTPVAYIIFKRTGLIRQCYLISLHSSYTHTMYEFGKGSLKGREWIIRSLAHYTAKLHDSGIYHKDFSPGNILFQLSGDEVKFSLVDINRLQFRRVSIKKGCANFARLWGGDEMFRLIAQEYAVARHADRDDCIRWVLGYRKRFWRKYTRKYPMPFSVIPSPHHS